jgi:hypothetical protein
LRLVHLAPVAADLAATAVDIRNADGTLVAEGVTYGTFGGFVEMPAGIIDLMVTDPADPETILLNTGPIVLKDGDVMTLFEAGEPTTGRWSHWQPSRRLRTPHTCGWRTWHPLPRR